MKFLIPCCICILFLFFLLHKVCDSWLDAVNLFFPLFTKHPKKRSTKDCGKWSSRLIYPMSDYVFIFCNIVTQHIYLQPQF